MIGDIFISAVGRFAAGKWLANGHIHRSLGQSRLGGDAPGTDYETIDRLANGHGY